MKEDRTYGALVLVSGGLDSRLAICVLRDAGVNVKGIVFDSPFYAAEKGREACAALGVHCHMYDFTSDIVELLDNPAHGFGKGMNPCIDCHARMLKRAGEMLPELGCDFLATGEVLDQRPMSQNRRSLGIVAVDSDYADLIVRPLSAQLLDPSLPEREGWVDRSKLLALSGRGRKPQFALAKAMGVTDYPSPAGGCRLTDPNFSRRLKEMVDHEGIPGVRDIELLRVGRHFRLSPRVKLVMGRDADENASIESVREPYEMLLTVESVPGPSALLPLTASEEEINLAAEICASYGDAPDEGTVAVRIKSDQATRDIDVIPAKREAIDGMRV